MNTLSQESQSSPLERCKYGILRWLLNTVGKLSDGVKVGMKYGFDSGESLDYVYENKAKGAGPLGRLLDRCYLDSPGWSGIRTRGERIKETIHWAIDKSSEGNEQIELIDIAAGPGRYVLNVLHTSTNAGKVNARLYDLDEKGLEFGKQKADALHLNNVEFIKRDAFSKDSTSQNEKQADIAIVSGLYELFPDNEMVSRSLQSLSERVREGGYLIYTNQPWHPQLEFIANVLTNRNGEPWVMRCRSQAEMDNLVRAAGFEKIGMRSDERGIFTVSVATKRNMHLIKAA